jgi:hypothetical protein
MAVWKKQLANKKAAMKVNLRELLGTSVPNDPRLREAIGQAIIDKIVERTSGGRSYTGSKFAGYSKEYIDSLGFKAYGKSENQVNLKQSGDMLGLMDVIDQSRDTITIGWNDETEAAKAHGHVTGNIGVKRDFLGLNQKEIEEIRSEFQPLLDDSEGGTDGSSRGDSRSTNDVSSRQNSQFMTFEDRLRFLSGGSDG